MYLDLQYCSLKLLYSLPFHSIKKPHHHHHHSAQFQHTSPILQNRYQFMFVLMEQVGGGDPNTVKNVPKTKMHNLSGGLKDKRKAICARV